MVSFETILLTSIMSITSSFDLIIPDLLSHSTIRDRRRIIYNTERFLTVIEYYVNYVIIRTKNDKPLNFSSVGMIDVIIARAIQNGLLQSQFFHLVDFDDAFRTKFVSTISPHLVTYLQRNCQILDDGKQSQS